MMSLRNMFFRSSPRRMSQHGKSRTALGPVAERSLRLELLESRSMLSSVTAFALAAGSDSGVFVDPPTFTDNITNVTTPTMTGTAPKGDTVNVYVENDGSVNGAPADVTTQQLLGTTTVASDGTWSVTSTVNLSTEVSNATTDGERTLFAYDTKNVVSDYVAQNIFIDTAGPQVASVTYASNGQSVLQQPAPGPTPATTALDVTFTDAPVRTADFDFPAIDSVLAQDPTNYSLVGASGGTIAITSAIFIDQSVVGGSGTTQVQLNFANPLPDDTYTLTVFDSLQNPAGSALDGLGIGTPGSGNYVASFTVQGGASLAVQLSAGIQSTDLQSASGATITTLPFYRPSDTVFSGNFANSSGAADGFDKLAAYGVSNGQYGIPAGQYRFLFQTETGAITAVTSPIQKPGYPVAGNFDGDLSNGDEVGIFTGTTWYLFNNSLTGVVTTVNWSSISGPTGLPVVGDFNGEGIPDLAVWSNGSFYVSFGSNSYAEIDRIIPVSFAGSGINVRPVAGDVDGAINASTGDPISDLGLWIPSGVPSTTTPANWFFLPSGGTPLNQQTSFTPVYYQFGSSVGVPLAGTFDPAELTAGSVPVITPINTTTIPATVSVAKSLTAKVASPVVTSLTVNGTAKNESVQLAAGKLPDTWVLTVNGVKQTIGSSITTLNINGLAGSNTLSILGTGKAETAEIWPTETIFHSGGLTVTATNFNKTTVNGGAHSNDSVLFHDTAGNSAFVAAANSSSLTGANSTAVALNFAKAVALSAPGEKSIANFYETTNAAVIKESKSASVIDFSDKGVAAESAFFSKVQIYNPAGKLVETIVPTASNTSPATRLASTNLSTATSVHLLSVAAAAQNKKKVILPFIPQLVDIVMASSK